MNKWGKINAFYLKNVGLITTSAIFMVTLCAPVLFFTAGKSSFGNIVACCVCYGIIFLNMLNVFYLNYVQSMELERLEQIYKELKKEKAMALLFADRSEDKKTKPREYLQ